jgi:hypothetical protein
MSIKVMTGVWQYSSLKGTERLTLLALADCASDEGVCWPSLSTIARKVNCSVPRLCKIITGIERKGELKRQRSTGGWNKRSNYKITVAENTVTGNSVAGNSIAECNSILSPATDALNRNRTVNISARTKRTRHITPPDPRTNTLIASFRDKYLSTVGKPYPTNHGKDQARLKALLVSGSDLGAIEAAMDFYFASDFYSRYGFDVGKFCNAFASIISAGAKKAHDYDAGAYPEP